MLVVAARAAINAAPVTAAAAAAVKVDAAPVAIVAAALEMNVAMAWDVAAQVNVAPENVFAAQEHAAMERAAATKPSAALKIAAAAVIVAAAARSVSKQATVMRRVPIFAFAAAARLLPTIRFLVKLAAIVATARASVVQLVLRAVVVDPLPLLNCPRQMTTKR
jgi:hypothetical protein